MAKITELPVKTLVKVLTKLKGGEIGFDPYRDDRTRTKDKLLSYILTNHTNPEIIAAVDEIVNFAAVDAGDLAKRNPDGEYNMHRGDAKPADIDPFAPVDVDAYARAMGIPPIMATPEAPQAAPITDPRLQALQALLTPAIDEAQIKKLVALEVAGIAYGYWEEFSSEVKTKLSNYDSKIEALTQRKPIVERIVIEAPDKPAVEIRERVNPAFHEILAIAQCYPNIMLVGPAGCGKTHLAAQVAQALGKSFSTISGSAGISESHFTGRLLPTGDNGKFEYTESPFIAEYSKPNGCFLVDEFDALDPNCLMIIQGATANGGFTVEARKAAGLDPHVPRGKGSLLLASANTYGNGADSLYVGRFQQDAAANDRWYFIPVDYDRELEAQLAPDEICDWIWQLREKVAEHKIRRVVSTRMVQKAAAARAAKRPLKEIRERMLAGWTREERAKCGV